MFISGATGDAGHWTGVADTLANEYTVITYDRRGNSRSPRPSGWTSTTVDEQADDAAALLQGLDLAPAIVFGTSAGASIAANLAIRHPAVLRGVIFHEPVFRSGVASAANSRERRKALFDEGMAKGGIRAATELFLLSVAGQATYESLDPELRERLLLNGDVLVNIELTPLPEYEPTPEGRTKHRSRHECHLSSGRARRARSPTRKTRQSRMSHILPPSTRPY